MRNLPKHRKLTEVNISLTFLNTDWNGNANAYSKLVLHCQGIPYYYEACVCIPQKYANKTSKTNRKRTNNPVSEAGDAYKQFGI